MSSNLSFPTMKKDLGRVGRSYAYWYEVEDLEGVKRFAVQTQPPGHAGYNEIARQWTDMLESGEADMEKYRDIGRDMYWR